MTLLLRSLCLAPTAGYPLTTKSLTHCADSSESNGTAGVSCCVSVSTSPVRSMLASCFVVCETGAAPSWSSNKRLSHSCSSSSPVNIHRKACLPVLTQLSCFSATEYILVLHNSIPLAVLQPEVALWILNCIGKHQLFGALLEIAAGPGGGGGGDGEEHCMHPYMTLFALTTCCGPICMVQCYRGQ